MDELVLIHTLLLRATGIGFEYTSKDLFKNDLTTSFTSESYPIHFLPFVVSQI